MAHPYAEVEKTILGLREAFVEAERRNTWSWIADEFYAPDCVYTCPYGGTIAVVANGREAVAEAGKSVFDLVLMDLQMPEMDGFEATIAVRANELVTGAHLPVIALTAHALKGDRERCLEGGMDGYLSKPIRGQELDAVLDVYTARKSAKLAPEPEHAAQLS